MNINFSVLIAIYNKENPFFFNRALESICNQTVKPNEVVLVKDGPLTLELENVIVEWKDKFNNFKIIELKTNEGLAVALNHGLAECSHEYVARMDSDDVSSPHRFEQQINFLKNNSDLDLIGSWISEFEGDEETILNYRKLPTSHEAIYRFAKKRNPINHVTVLYKKSKVLEAGGYKFRLAQDYHLWVKMLLNNAKMENLPEYLVNVRIGHEMRKRRGGRKYFLIEYQMQKEFLSLGFIKVHEFIFNVLLRLIFRFLGSGVRKLLYKRFLRQ